MRHFILLFLAAFVSSGIHAQMVSENLTTGLQLQAEVLYDQKEWKRAEEVARSALAVLEEEDSTIALQVRLINILGDCALEQSYFAEAFRQYEKSRALLGRSGKKNAWLQVEVLNKLGNFYREIKDVASALNYLSRAEELATDSLGKHHLKVSDVYNNLGLCMRFMGDFDKALDYHNQALLIRRQQLASLHPDLAQCYNNIGLALQMKGQLQSALDTFARALHIYQRPGKEHLLDLADVYNNMANVHGKMEEMNQFIRYHQKALEIWKKKLTPGHPSIALSYNNLANGYSFFGQYRRANALYREALDIRIKNYGSSHPDVAQTFYNLGINYYQEDSIDQAFESFQQCLASLNYKVDTEFYLDDINDHGQLLDVLPILADIKKVKYERDNRASHLTEAMSYYVQADELIDFLRTRYETIGSKYHLAQAAYHIYDSAIELGQALSQISGDHKFQYLAFQFAEKSKGLLLLESLKRSQAELFAGIPTQVLEDLRQTESQIGELEKSKYLRLEEDADRALDSLSDLIFEKKQQVFDQINSLQSNYPDYYNLRYSTTTISIDEIQQIIQEGQTVLEYFLGEDWLHIFVVNKDSFQVVSTALPVEFFKWLENFHLSISQFPIVPSTKQQQNLTEYAFSAHQLYQVLIRPVQHLLEQQIIIVPDGELNLLPFSALLSAYPDELRAVKNYPFLLHDHTISYSYSATLLKELQRKRNPKVLQNYLGLAPSFLEGNEKGLTELSYNNQEVTSVEQKIRGKILSGPSATKDNFLAIQSNFRIIHLATHGKANSAMGDYSFLAFSETEEARGDEALLFVRDIYNMSTHAEMIVLSACETGAGQLHKGEGVASISRSFSYAGAKSLIATIWSVDDAATNQLIQLFFEKISDGYLKDKALQDAQIGFIAQRGNKNAHPYYWASFIPVGNMNKISFNAGLHLSAVIPLFFLLLLPLVYSLKRKYGQ